MKLRERKIALLLIDIQKGFENEKYWGGNRNNKDAEQKASKILNKWRELNLPIFHIVHSSQNQNSMLHKSQIGFQIKDEVKPIKGEPVIEKNVNSAFIGTNLKEQLENKGIKDLVIIGLTTDHCVSTSTRMAGNFGFNVLVISDATATFDRVGINGEQFDSETIHQTALASLHNEFAKVIDMKELFRLV
ncbi:cysteine hydrolase family protein [Pasteurella skyensis]|uniref:Cysteine hydrolase family protein n=1 Tax=Phocoenobacter skyensis TaxID=97481 RepID=A0AAJ6P122_9PAST|nr:cysteine hydrolase family protein [Pasteurella skyensis]MDP8163251.1 cysteine hydrolase family protein [Pasteurella skyensis]MDP8173282.1 cysteine hydrolase family protein [Pasteurella skyensis]MDP8176935.1 cysteine hydrolase family protein [Pasteurella skyensis]MDP8179692.1 cysteine hydrolase family protein [Pasteurella skyensis]MDP8182715.1 cysteine hydrolase family protein [Pasteurella skyensis]